MPTISTATNPVVKGWPGNSAPGVQTLTSATSKTWKHGELAFLSSNTVTPVVNAGKTDAQYIYVDTQDTATAAGATARVKRLSSGTRLMIRVTNDGTDALETDVDIGQEYGVYGLSNVTYLDANTGSGAFRVVARGSALNEYEMPATLSPGYVEVEYIGLSN